ncbi:MAG: ComF family protein [Candidatus Aquirickettsiella sp.]
MINISIILKQINKGIIRCFYPYHCILCDDKTYRELDLCLECEKFLPWLRNVCIYCAAPLVFPTPSACGVCLKKPLLFHKLCVCFSYTEIIRKLVTGLKFQQQLIYAHILGSLLAKKVSSQYQSKKLPDIIIPVPLHKKRLYERGFNQAIELARPISKKLNIPIEYKRCKRVVNTAAQSKLPANQRSNNVKNAFIAHQDLAYLHIALLDDVMTTGHTLTEMSRALYYVGVKRIDVWCCARTYLGGN